MKWIQNKSQSIINILRFSKSPKCLFIYRNVRLYTDAKAPYVLKDTGQPPVGFLGFFIGTSFATAAGYYFLVNEYQHASNTLLLSIEELQRTTDSVIESVKQIEEMEKNIKRLQNNAVTKNDIQNVRTDTKKMFESLNLAHLEVNERLSELEIDVAKLSRYARTVM
ncbi:hypothetical protein PMAC_001676 [Pneumocystis sp. 'macacae']|nr:hypothetical protein PMAC_001676 [Pneumocystis sp. 'macacae']